MISFSQKKILNTGKNIKINVCQKIQSRFVRVEDNKSKGLYLVDIFTACTNIFL